ncbi:MAG TPA: hypothetical protein DEB06_00425 [Phycisphaerales bacterium]|nr:hypothetical protein [Phycisphaerales bacterium]
MPFTGKATYGAGADLPEIAEDVADIISIVSPFETPLLDHLGDPRTVARSTVHEWLEDSLLPNTDAINQSSFSPSATAATAITVDNGARFRVGDQVRAEPSMEVMLVTAVAGNVLTVTRGYGGTTAEALADNMVLVILGNAALEGDDRPATRFTNRVRKANYTQIFTASVEVSGSQQAVQAIGSKSELEYQKQERLRELLRDLENCVINGVSPASTPQGGSTTRRTMRGLIASIQTNRFTIGQGPIPVGVGAGDTLDENTLNATLREIWEQSSARIDTIVVNGFQKRRINLFVGDRGYAPKDTKFKDLVSVYESDFGVARVLVSRWMPPDTVLFLDSSRLSVMPLAGRSFHFKPLASSGDSEVGQVIGEYTLQVMNENAHGFLTGLAVA